MNRATLLTAIRIGRDRLEAALASLPDEAMLDRIDETWTRKDVVAHLEAWERRVVELLDRLRAGEEPRDEIETDERNARFHARDRDRDLADVRAGEQDAYVRLVHAIETATDDELFDGSHFPWTEGDPFESWLRGNSDEHYDEHLEQLKRPAR
jgi:hypothetical protein